MSDRNVNLIMDGNINGINNTTLQFIMGTAILVIIWMGCKVVLCLCSRRNVIPECFTHIFTRTNPTAVMTPQHQQLSVSFSSRTVQAGPTQNDKETQTNPSTFQLTSQFDNKEPQTCSGRFYSTITIPMQHC